MLRCGYDLDAANATVAAATSERLPGDPLWLMIVGGPGGAKIGDRGTLVIKDFTSILSAERTTSTCVVGAQCRLRRRPDVDLDWPHRHRRRRHHRLECVHAVVATMGDRFALLRLQTGASCREADRGAIRNTGREVAIR
jgi:hypothetical protein